MPTRSLPLRPNLAQLKLQANELHQQHRQRSPAAGARIAAHHPRFKGAAETAVLGMDFVLADAQLVVAREYGFDSWPRLKHAVEISEALAAFQPHPHFEAAVAAMDNGDVAELRRLLNAHPDLVQARTNLEPPYHYFTGATLLHHVAGNPDRGRLQGLRPPLPANSAEIAKTLLDAGADVNASTIASYSADAMALVVTSKQASDANVSGPLIDVLLQSGARLDLTSDDCLDPSLANHAPRAAERMLELGALPDLFVAAALGRIDLLRQLFGDDGRLRSVPRRKGKEMASPDAVGLAMLYAYVREEYAAVDFLLEKDGNWNMVGVNNGAALHRATFKGDLPMVQRLVSKGADVSNRDNPYHSTPLAWADHNKQTAVVDWLRANTAVDLHDAASFAFREHVEARLREKPESVNATIDQWDIPESTALHWAAALGHLEIVSLLLDRGADPDLLAGNGMRAQDLAAAEGHADVVGLLERRKGNEVMTSPFPDWLQPMAATLTEERFTGSDWIFERKYDGIRVLAFKHGGEVRLLSRNRLSLNGSYPAVVRAIEALPVDDVILDGESTAGWEQAGDADYYVFDILRLAGRDLTPLPLEERRVLLDRLPLELPLERVAWLTDERPWDRACAEGWEGVIAKRRDSRYEHKRSKSWLKMKCEETHAFVVGGFTDPQGKRVGLGALLVGYFDGPDLCFAGKLGTGFDNALLVDLRTRLDALEVPKTLFTRAKGLPRLRAHWVKPEVVVEAGFIEWTGNGKLRHPRLLRVLDGVAPVDVVRREHLAASAADKEHQ